MNVFRGWITRQSPRSISYEQIRSIPRWASRVPKKVYLPEETEPLDTVLRENNKPEHKKRNSFNYPTTFSFQGKEIAETSGNNVDNKSVRREKLETLTLRKAKKKEETSDMLETIIDGEGNLVYTKMNNNDSRIAQILSNLKSDKSLKKQESILLEGKRLIKEALRSGCKLQYILFSRKSDLEEIKSDLPKIGAKLYKMPYREMQLWSNLVTNPGMMGVFKIPEVKEVQYDIPVNVICDNIREPGNLGAILRTCAGVGCKKVILTKGCCDIWNTKVLRSAMGAHFKLNIQKLGWEEMKEQLSGSNWFIADNNTITSSRSSTSIVDLVENISLSSYHSLKYSGSDEISLIIGGETEGISEEAFSLVASLGGLRINIPLGNDIESLNSSTALAVIIFEMKRQIKGVN